MKMVIIIALVCCWTVTNVHAQLEEDCAGAAAEVLRAAQNARSDVSDYAEKPRQRELEYVQLRLKEIDYLIVRAKRACEVSDLLQLGEPIRRDSPTQILPRNSQKVQP